MDTHNVAEWLMMLLTQRQDIADKDRMQAGTHSLAIRERELELRKLWEDEPGKESKVQ